MYKTKCNQYLSVVYVLLSSRSVALKILLSELFRSFSVLRVGGLKPC